LKSSGKKDSPHTTLPAGITGTRHSMDASMIQDAYQELTTARDELYSAGEMVIQTKNVADNMRAEKIANGEIVGKNEDERKAKARELLAGIYGMLEGYEKGEREARRNFDTATYRVEMVRALLRLEELRKV
jgi:hypothetical protein